MCDISRWSPLGDVRATKGYIDLGSVNNSLLGRCFGRSLFLAFMQEGGSFCVFGLKNGAALGFSAGDLLRAGFGGCAWLVGRTRGVFALWRVRADLPPCGCGIM